MKKQYETPNAKKVEFDYSENVVASGTPTQDANSCACKKPWTPPAPTKTPTWFLGFYISCKWW